MAAAKFRAWDDYFIPGTSVLRNKLGLTTMQGLRDAEEKLAQIRLLELAANPIPGAFDYRHMKAIHRRIFQDVYEWAGQERVGPITRMTKDGPDVVHFAPGDPAAPMVAYAYFPAPAIAAAADEQYHQLARDQYLTGLDKKGFVERLAEYWGEINVIHSFREGNTRAQFVFFSQLAENAGYHLDAEAFKIGSPLREEFVAARFYNQATTKTDRLAAVLSATVQAAGRAPDPASKSVRNPSPAVIRFPELRGVRLPTGAAARFPELADDEPADTDEQDDGLDR